MEPKLLLAHLLTFSLTGPALSCALCFACAASDWARLMFDSCQGCAGAQQNCQSYFRGLTCWWWALPRHSAASPSQSQCYSAPLAAGSLLHVSIQKPNSFGRELPVEKEEFGNILFLPREQENALRAKTQSDMMHQTENGQEVLMFIFNWKHPTSRGYSNFFFFF